MNAALPALVSTVGASLTGVTASTRVAGALGKKSLSLATNSTVLAVAGSSPAWRNSTDRSAAS